MQARAKDESLTHASENLRAAQDAARRAGTFALPLIGFFFALSLLTFFPSLSHSF